MFKRKTGRIPSLRSFKDFNINTDSVKNIIQPIGLDSITVQSKTTLPSSVSLKQYCSPVEDQGNLGSCVAQAAASLIEYYERKVFGNHTEASRLFIYYNTRKLMNTEAWDSGSSLKLGMAALVLFGAPPEKYYPYVETNFTQSPEAFHYSFAANYKTLRYFRLDVPSIELNVLLRTIKTFLAAQIPIMFGTTVYTSIDSAEVAATGNVPFPTSTESAEGGHALLAVGYDDNKVIMDDNTDKTTGAILIKNSWGKEYSCIIKKKKFE
jgi:C1A family cysteine protease